MRQNTFNQAGGVGDVSPFISQSKNTTAQFHPKGGKSSFANSSINQMSKTVGERQRFAASQAVIGNVAEEGAPPNSSRGMQKLHERLVKKLKIQRHKLKSQTANRRAKDITDDFYYRFGSVEHQICIELDAGVIRKLKAPQQTPAP